jgi:dihydrofolate reductase
MRKITAFTIVSVDGYFAGPNGEIDWFKNIDAEDTAFTHENVTGSATLVFGRTTYELMKSYWPTPDAIKNDPVMSGVMNSSQKIVFSRTMKPVADGPVWKNVSVVHEINKEEIVKLKKQKGSDLVILGSGSIVRELANLNLIDEFQLLVNPVILGAGKPLFADFKRMDLKRTDARTFTNGKIFLKYQPT